MKTGNTDKTATQPKLVLVNIRGNIYPMREEEYNNFLNDTDWLSDTFKTW